MDKNNKNQFSKQFNNGFSIIEVLVGMFIIVLVGLAVWTFQQDVFQLNTILSGSFGAQEEARTALKIMSAEIRSLSPSSTGSYAIAEAGSSSFTFYSDIDDDGLKERLRYFLDGATLKKGTLKPSGNPLTYNPANEQIREIIHDVASGATPLFSYYDANYDGATAPLSEPVNILSVRLVKITATIDSDPLRPPGPLILTTQISMRNLKDNL